MALALHNSLNGAQEAESRADSMVQEVVHTYPDSRMVDVMDAAIHDGGDGAYSATSCDDKLDSVHLNSETNRHL